MREKNTWNWDLSLCRDYNIMWTEVNQSSLKFLKNSVFCEIFIKKTWSKNPKHFWACTMPVQFNPLGIFHNPDFSFIMHQIHNIRIYSISMLNLLKIDSEIASAPITRFERAIFQTLKSTRSAGSELGPIMKNGPAFKAFFGSLQIR